MYSSLFRISCLLFSTGAAVQTLSAEPIEAHGKAPVAKKREKAMLHVGVSSAASDTGDRQAIRDCWMKHNLLQGDNPKVRAHFLVAKPDEGSSDKETLDKDMAEHPDEFLQVDAPEGYRNLTKKIVAYFKWAAQDQQAHYYMKLDDNNYPNLQFMYDHFERNLLEGTTHVYAGEIISGWKAVPWGKYSQDPAGWAPYTPYPDYANGDGYIVSADLVKIAFGDQIERNQRHQLDNEDVNTGFWVDNVQSSGVANVTYQLLPERIDFSCNPIGCDKERCCAADKAEKGQWWPSQWNNPGFTNVMADPIYPRQWRGGKTLEEMQKQRTK